MGSFTSPDIDEKLELLHREMASLRAECDRLLNKHSLVEHTLSQSCSAWPNGAADTSSAYNTGGESCRSVSVTPDAGFLPNNNHSSLNQTQQSPRVLRRTSKLPSPSVQRRAVPQIPPTCSRLPTVILPHDVPNEQKHNPKQLHRTKEAIIQEPVIVVTDDRTSMASSSKTNRSIIRMPNAVFGALRGASLKKLSVCKNVKSTMRLEEVDGARKEPTIEAEECAKRFRIPSYSVVLKEEKRRGSFRIPVPQYFKSMKSKQKTDFFDQEGEEELEEVIDEEKMANRKEVTDTTIHYKWKLKRRCDGSRYIVKRPIRSQILKKREAQLYRERAPISTDDDAMSELKLGRFHTKEERKQILEREKMKKMHKLQQKIAEKADPTEQAIFQMSQQKMARQKDTMVMDEFATTREVLSSRTRPDGIHGVVSVTTV